MALENNCETGYNKYFATKYMACYGPERKSIPGDKQILTYRNCTQGKYRGLMDTTAHASGEREIYLSCD